MFASVPFGNDPNTLVIESESSVDVLLGESLAVTIATTPLPIAVAPVPDAIQIRVPVAEPQVSVSPTAVRAGPAEAVREVIAAEE